MAIGGNVFLQKVEMISKLIASGISFTAMGLSRTTLFLIMESPPPKGSL
jgi:hypothetical protein